MTQYLPPNLLALFAPRDPCPFLPPPDKLPHEKKNRGYNGVGDFLQHFEDPGDTPPPLRVETREERMERRRRERSEQVAYKLEQEIAMWDPHNLPLATSDPFKTLFIARINYDTSESKLRREFEVYGPIKKIVLTHNVNDAKPRGYAFIEYEHERDMHTAYKHADGKKIDGRRVLVDVERGRTVKGWLPRRLGGGLGGTRRGGPDVNIKHSGREDNERERERYRLERERESRAGDRLDRVADRTTDRERRRSRSRDRDTTAARPRRRTRSRSPRDRSKRHRSRSRERRGREAEGEETEETPRRERAEREEETPRRERPEREEETPRRERGERGGGEEEPPARRERGEREEEPPRRERDRERDRKRRRSRSKDRDRKKDSRRDRDRDSRKERRDRYDRGDDDEPRIKEEPVDDYPEYMEPSEYMESANFGNANVKFEREGDVNGSRRNLPPPPPPPANNYPEDDDDEQDDY